MSILIDQDTPINTALINTINSVEVKLSIKIDLINKKYLYFTNKKRTRHTKM
jgi:hypothetical protein